MPRGIRVYASLLKTLCSGASSGSRLCAFGAGLVCVCLGFQSRFGFVWISQKKYIHIKKSRSFLWDWEFETMAVLTG